MNNSLLLYSSRVTDPENQINEHENEGQEKQSLEKKKPQNKQTDLKKNFGINSRETT